MATGLVVQWFSNVIQAPGSPSLSALPCLSYNSFFILKSFYSIYSSFLKDITRYHSQTRKSPTEDDSTSPCLSPWVFEETFSEITCQISPLFIYLKLGPMTTVNQFLAMRKGLSLRIKTDQELSPVLWGGIDTQTMPANSKEAVARIVT